MSLKIKWLLTTIGVGNLMKISQFMCSMLCHADYLGHKCFITSIVILSNVLKLFCSINQSKYKGDAKVNETGGLDNFRSA